VPTAYLSPSQLQDLTNVSSTAPGSGDNGKALVWSDTTGKWQASSIDRLEAPSPLLFRSGQSSGTIAERARIHPKGSFVYSSDSVGAFVVAAFGKNNIPDNTVTPLFKFVSSNNAVFGLVHAYFSLEDLGNNLYLSERIYRLFWNGGALIFDLQANLATLGSMPTFTPTASGNTVTVSGSFTSTLNNGWSISMAFQWIPYGYTLNAVSIEPA
jgi:hypothetical protein